MSTSSFDESFGMFKDEWASSENVIAYIDLADSLQGTLQQIAAKIFI